MRPALRSLLCDCLPSPPSASTSTGQRSGFSTMPSTLANTAELPSTTSAPHASDCSDSTHSTDSSISKAKTAGIVIGSFFGTLLSIILLRRFIVMWKRRQRRQSVQSSRRSSEQSRRSVWVWLGEMVGGEKRPNVLGSGFRHLHRAADKAGKLKSG